jgi:hypothetical protein
MDRGQERHRSHPTPFYRTASRFVVESNRRDPADAGIGQVHATSGVGTPIDLTIDELIDRRSATV